MAIILLVSFLGGTVAVTLLAYFLMHRFAAEKMSDHTKDLAASVMVRVSVLHGLILALVFAQQMVQYQQLRGETTDEASAIADVYHDAERYGDTPATAAIRQAMVRYSRLVVDEEWPHLGSTGHLLPAAWAEWDRAYDTTLDLVPTTPRETSLRDHMLQRIHAISDMRDKRENITDRATSHYFWLAAVIGVVFIAIAYFPFPPSRYNLLLLSIYGAFTGIVLFFIAVFENPFMPPAEQRPRPIERLLEGFEQPPA